MASVSVTELLTRAFIDRSLPCDAWTHEAHLRVGLWHLLHHSPMESLELLRRRITGYNEACGVINSESSGYHETTTRFYVLLIDDFVHRQHRRSASAVELDRLAEKLIATHGDKRLPFEFYSEDRLMSAEARRRWVEPDLQPLPDGRRL